MPDPPDLRACRTHPNLAANPRASLMIAKVLGEGEVARISLVGEVCPLDPDPLLVTRYLRYHPHAERFLQLGDFGFYRLEPVRVMTGGGFAKASWLEGERLLEASSISLAQETALLEAAANEIPDRLTLLGVDAYGVDVMMSQGRARVRFSVGPVTLDALLPTLVRELEHQGFAVRKPLSETP